MTHNIGFILLSIYLILTGLGLLGALSLPAILMGILAGGAGVFILLGK